MPRTKCCGQERVIACMIIKISSIATRNIVVSFGNSPLGVHCLTTWTCSIPRSVSELLSI